MRGPLDVRYSMTMLCWVYYSDQHGQDEPLFNYRTSGTCGVGALMGGERETLCVLHKTCLFIYNPLINTDLTGGWKFVGASYDRGTGEAQLWLNGAVVQTLNIGAGLDLATQDPITMGVKIGDGRYFKSRIAQMQVYNYALSQEQIKATQGHKFLVRMLLPQVV